MLFIIHQSSAAGGKAMCNDSKKELDDSDKRIAPRIPARVLVEYETVEDFLIDYTANMSIGGMFIQTADPLPVGTRFRLRFRIPGRAGPVETEAEVCWVLRGEKGGVWQPGMGVRFESLSDDDHEAVQRLLAEWR